MVLKTINTTVDLTTHKLWGNVAKKEGVTRIDLLRGLIAERADQLGLKIPRALEDFV